MNNNFNMLNAGLLLAGILFVLAGFYNRSLGELLRGVITGDTTVFQRKATVSSEVGGVTNGSSGSSGLDGGGGFGGGGGGTW